MRLRTQTIKWKINSMGVKVLYNGLQKQSIESRSMSCNLTWQKRERRNASIIINWPFLQKLGSNKQNLSLHKYGIFQSILGKWDHRMLHRITESCSLERTFKIMSPNVHPALPSSPLKPNYHTTSMFFKYFQW